MNAKGNGNGDGKTRKRVDFGAFKAWWPVQPWLVKVTVGFAVASILIALVPPVSALALITGLLTIVLALVSSLLTKDKAQRKVRRRIAWAGLAAIVVCVIMVNATGQGQSTPNPNPAPASVTASPADTKDQDQEDKAKQEQEAADKAKKAAEEEATKKKQAEEAAARKAQEENQQETANDNGKSQDSSEKQEQSSTSQNEPAKPAAPADKQAYGDSDLSAVYGQCKGSFPTDGSVGSIDKRNGVRGQHDQLWVYLANPVADNKGWQCVASYFGIDADLTKTIGDAGTSGDETGRTVKFKNLDVVYQGRTDPLGNVTEPLVIIKPNSDAKDESSTQQPPQQDSQSQSQDGPYSSCAAARAAGAAPLYQGQPGYSTKLDKDGDGVACE